VKESLLEILKMECLTFYLILEIGISTKGPALKDEKTYHFALSAPARSPQTSTLEPRHV